MSENKSILGIDVSKAKLDVCLLMGEKARHKVFANTPEGFEKMETWCGQQGVGALHICLESSGWYGERVSFYWHNKGQTVSIINPARIKAFGRSEGQRTKTDKMDAGVIARFCRAHNPAAWTPPSNARRYLQDLYRTLVDLKSMEKQCINHLEKETMTDVARSYWQDSVKMFHDRIRDCEHQIASLVSENNDLKQCVENISSIKGVGFLTAVAILAETPDISRFEDVRQFVAFAGLNPCERQSGSSVRGKTRISKEGSSHLRKALYMPAISVKNTNPHFEKFCNTLKKRGKPGKVIVVAIMRKLMHIIFGILKHNTPFDPQKLTQTAGKQPC
jgi:transposase